MNDWYANELARIWSLRVVTPTAVEPVSLELARAHLRLEAYDSPPQHADDTWLSTVGIPAARELCELLSGRSFAEQTFELALDGFPGWYAGPFPRPVPSSPGFSLTVGTRTARRRPKCGRA
jgi:hypothetical protein